MADEPDTTGCPFCERIQRGDAWGTVDPRIVAFDPLNPVTPGHRLFVPISHVESAAADPEFAGAAMTAAATWAASVGGDCNLITSCGAAATQTIKHLHVHVVPRRAGDGLPLPWTPQQSGEGFDWRGIVDRASAVAVGAGAPDDGATLPEQVEWLAAELHGPSLRAREDGGVPILWRAHQEFADGTTGWRYWGELPGVPVWMPVGGELTIRIDHRSGLSEPIARCETGWIS